MDGPTLEEMTDLAKALHISLANLAVASGAQDDMTIEARAVLDRSKAFFGYWPPVPGNVPTAYIGGHHESNDDDDWGEERKKEWEDEQGWHGS